MDSSSGPESYHRHNHHSATYEFPYEFPYAMAMAISPSPSLHRVAIGSFIEDYSNHVDVFSFDHEALTLTPSPSLSFDHPYPPTKLQFHPSYPNIVASSADFLRLHHLSSPAAPPAVLDNSKSSELCAPLTSFDWNDVGFFLRRSSSRIPPFSCSFFPRRYSKFFSMSISPPNLNNSPRKLKFPTPQSLSDYLKPRLPSNYFS